MKKRIGIALLCALLCCMPLAGCGGAEDSSAAGGSGAGSKYTFVLRGVEIAVNADMAPVVEKLGEPTGYLEATSCVFDGMDREYTYGGVIIRTWPAGERDHILTVDLRDDTVSTREGLYVGAGREDVTAAYGEPTEETSGMLRYVDGDCTLTFTMENDRVTGITYASDAA